MQNYNPNELLVQSKIREDGLFFFFARGSLDPVQFLSLMIEFSPQIKSLLKIDSVNGQIRLGFIGPLLSRNLTNFMKE